MNGTKRKQRQSVMTNTYHAFLSYTRHDDKSSGGRITRLKELLETEIRSVLGVRDFEIFQDVDDIEAGDHWPSLLDGMVDQARFFIPVLTPSYFTSPMCRRELQRFIDAENEFRRGGLILPILFRKCSILTDETRRSNDPLAELIHERNYSDWTALRKANLETGTIPDHVEILAERIERIWHAPTTITEISKEKSPPPAQKADPTETKAQSLEQLLESANAEIAELRRQLSEVGKDKHELRTQRAFGPHRTVFREVNEVWCPKMVVIDPPDKSFMMGAPEDKAKSRDSERPQHAVVIARKFALGRYTVTFEEFDAYCESVGNDLPYDRGWGRGRMPVINMSWDDAQRYFAWLNERLGLAPGTYRLPSEAEWEFACRAGTTGPFWTGETITTDQANYNGNYPYGDGARGEYRERTVAVHEMPNAVNPWGLAHMHGNVWEWTEDCWNSSYSVAGWPDDGSAWETGDCEKRVLRGGSWFNNAGDLRSAYRNWDFTGIRGSYGFGFRVARTL